MYNVFRKFNIPVNNTLHSGEHSIILVLLYLGTYDEINILLKNNSVKVTTLTTHVPSLNKIRFEFQ